MKYFLTTCTIFLLLFTITPLAHAQTTDCSATITTQDQWDDCCDNGGGAGQASPAVCDTYANRQNPDCSVAITNQIQYDDCCDNGGGTGQGSATSCSTYENANGLNPGNNGGQGLNGQLNSGAPSPTAGSLSTAAFNAGSALNTASGSVSSSTAAASCNVPQFKTVLDIAVWIKCIIGVIVIPGIFTLAFVIFLWGVLKFIRSSDQKDKEDSKQYIYVGLIGLFVMVSVWGIIKILSTTLGIQTVVPTLQTTTLTPAK